MGYTLPWQTECCKSLIILKTALRLAKSPQASATFIFPGFSGSVESRLSELLLTPRLHEQQFTSSIDPLSKRS
jgi:hypothetical protein